MKGAKTVGEILDEFNGLLEEQVEDNSTFEDDSLILVNRANMFLDKLYKSQETSYFGIDKHSYIDCISIGKTERMPWEHVKFTIDVSKLKDLAYNKLEEFIVPAFVEELESIGEDGEDGFGFNQTCRNILKFIEIPSSVVLIAPYTFAFYKKLQTIKFMKDCKLIYLGTQAFAGCESLHTLDLRNCKDLDEICEGAFDLSNITILKINSNLKNMCKLDNTIIEKIYVDDRCYSRKEFEQLIIDNNNSVFW